MSVMPAYDIAAGDRFGQDIDMPGMHLNDPAWTIALHDRPLLKAHKQLPRRDLPSSDLRSHYKKTQLRFPNGHAYGLPKPSTTPPNVPETVFFQKSPSPMIMREPSEHERDDSSNAETTILRSRVATPTYQNRPPTPDITPPRPDNMLRPRPVLANPASISSRADSFKTAREELSSDEEIEAMSPSRMPSRQRWLQNSQAARMEDWGVQPIPLIQNDGKHATAPNTIKRKPLPERAFATFDGAWESNVDTTAKDINSRVKLERSVSGTVNSTTKGGSLRSVTSHPSPLPTPPLSPEADEQSTRAEPPVQRGKSLRDRLKEQKMVRASDSAEEFARDIGWSHVYKSPDLRSRINSWRLSGISTTSTVEAIVVDAETTPQRQRQLRHSRKNPSLRSASSPFPASNRSSMLSNPDSPHRLIHKKGKITNKSRWSMGSEESRMMTVSFATPYPPRPEIIQVAVIPERKSSLQSSQNSTRTHSTSPTTASTGHHPFNAPDHAGTEVHGPLRKKRPMSVASLPVRGSSEIRGRDQNFPSNAPLRGLSLSAPTSRSNSRANSPTSEHFRMRRLAAEEDLHRTLARMESERSVVPRHNGAHSKKPSAAKTAEADREHWDALRSPSLYAAFSPQSMASASPGPVEMGQARAVNLFAHNNHSLQIVDQFAQPDPRAVMFWQGPGAAGQILAEEPTTPKQATLPRLVIDSPLRNPRDPPQPPVLQVIPPTPLDSTPVEKGNRQRVLPSLRSPSKPGSLSRRLGSLKRPTLGGRQHSESFVKSLSRTLSLRGARNMKADQPLDANLHPFWRPRAFWDDITDSDSDGGEYDRDVIVSNSLGVPQTRTIINGPISLVRHLSDNSRRRRLAGAGVTKRASHGSLSRIRAGKSLYKMPGFGRRFPFVKFGELQNRLQLSKRQKEDEKRERSRQALREKIGSQIISTGDSRYPAYMASVVSVASGAERG
jgi:hypothetical protein